jgi:hypothetical protein
MGGGGGGGGGGAIMTLNPDAPKWLSPSPSAGDQCRIKLGSHINGWDHGKVEELPAWYQDYEYTPKDGDNEEAKKLVERLNKISAVTLRQDNMHRGKPINVSSIRVTVNGVEIPASSAEQKSSHPAFPASNLLKTTPNSFAHTNSAPLEKGNQWMKVSFSQPFDFTKLDYIKIDNRRDCCHDRTRGLWVFLEDVDGKPVWYGRLQKSAYRDHILMRSDFEISRYTKENVYSDEGLYTTGLAGKSELQKEVDKLLEKKPNTRDFQHYRLHHGRWDTNTGNRTWFTIGNDDIDIMETQGDCKDVLWMYTDHGVYNSKGYTKVKDLNNNSFEKFDTVDGTIVPVNEGLNRLNDWNSYPAHGHFMNQISHLWAKPVPTDDYNVDMDVHGLIRSGHATIWRDDGGNKKKEAEVLFHGDNGRFMKQDATTTLACSTNHHNPHTQCPEVGRVVGEPCPGGKMHWLNSQKVRCYYETKDQIQTLKNSLASTKSNDPRHAMYENIKSKFCGDPKNLNTTIDGKKCKDWGDAEKLTREYCTANEWEKMKAGDNACTRSGMPNEDLFETLSSEFCDANAGDSWCKCYNQVKNVCEENPDAAGCKDVDDQISEILKDLPSDGSGTIARNEIKARRNCWAGVCSNDKDAFIPRERKDCNLDVCIQSLNVGGALAGSDVEMSCDTEETTDDADMKKYKEESEAFEVKGVSVGKDVAYIGGGILMCIFLMFCCLVLIMTLA